MSDLIIAVKGADVDAIEALLNDGADINMHEDGYQRTPLHAAVVEDNVQMVRFILTRGADVESKDFFGSTPLYLALVHQGSQGRFEIADILIEAGGDMNAGNNDDDTALHNAAENNLALVRYLLSRGANVNVINNRGETPLHVALTWGKTDIAKYLIYHGADLHIQDKYGITAFNLAAVCNQDTYLTRFWCSLVLMLM